jgi:hypothetical protein
MPPKRCIAVIPCKRVVGDICRVYVVVNADRYDRRLYCSASLSRRYSLSQSTFNKLKAARQALREWRCEKTKVSFSAIATFVCALALVKSAPPPALNGCKRVSRFALMAPPGGGAE